MPQLQYQKIVFASGLRVPKEKREPNLHYYDVSHEDGSFRPVMVAKLLTINHLGTIAVKKPLSLKTGGNYLYLTEAQKDAILEII
ncbi:LPD28 domain-containing protein [Lysinibacillus sp. UGB7]|uniref:LPD28 domain-containing protein n=1 Tax=Lysinibacillus sp. UGB7 TaxID=3411039 RepID=UPI003B772CC8